MQTDILLVGTPSLTTNLVFNTLTREIGPLHVVLEKPVSTFSRIKYRIKKLGLFKTIGQILFQTTVPPILRVLSQKRIQELTGSSSRALPDSVVNYIATVNSNLFLELVERLRPKVIVVNGTRIISEKILSQLKCPIINIHTGITPDYRGVHGGYWALFENQNQLCGVTIHYVDKGIDTGSVIYQGLIKISKDDNFITYPILQYIEALPHLVKTLKAILTHNKLEQMVVAGTGNSKQWYHPTLAEYVKGLLRGIK